MSRCRFTDSQHDRYTLGGLQQITKKTGTVPVVLISGIRFSDIRTTINTSSQAWIEIGFFKDCQVYIDNSNGGFKIRKK